MSSKIPPAGLQFQSGPQQQISQRLIMSAHMQQALRLLQIPLQDLEPFIEEQVVQNPLLEISRDEEIPSLEEEIEDQSLQETVEQEVNIDDKDLAILSRLEEDFREHFAESEPAPIKRTSSEDKLKSFLEQSICAKTSLQDQLIQQAHDSFETEEEIKIAKILIGYIDEFGFLSTPLCEICTLHQLEEIETQKILEEIQTFEPYGVGAPSIQESLLIQLRCLKKEQTLAYLIVRDHYDLLLHNHIPQMQKKLGCSYDSIQDAIEKDIAKLDLHPGTHFSSQSAQAIIPDVTIKQENEKLVVEVEREYIPSLRLNPRYLRMLNDPDSTPDIKRFLQHHLFSAKWLVRNLQQRFSTLELIAQSLAEKQYDFFTKPDGKLVPLIMKTLADELNVHESTIARTVSNKYLNSPRGLFPLRTFFTNKYVAENGEDLSSTTVKQAILDLIEKEERSRPLSDEKISQLLKQKGISCARRTVAKYRFILQLGSAHQRKKFS